MHRALAALLAASALAVPVLAAPAPPVQADAPALDPGGPLHAGDVLAVTMRGTAGGAASFDVVGVASGVPMQPVAPGGYGGQPAVYRGTYTVRPGDATLDAAVIGRLVAGGAEALAAAQARVTIDTQPPALVSRAPAAAIANDRPNLVAWFDDRGGAGVDPRSVRLAVNGREVSGQATVTPMVVAYTPPAALPAGEVAIDLAAADRAKNAARWRWAFTVRPGGTLIRSVTLNPATPLGPGDVLTVVAVGERGGRATFGIEGLEEDTPMREAPGRPGVYFGTHAAGAGENIREGRVVVRVEKSGRAATAAATAGVTIVTTPPPRPAITSPRPGNEVDGPLVIQGRAAPGQRILGRIAFETRGASGQLAGFAVVADRAGVWRVTLTRLARLPGALLTIAAIAVDLLGQRSQPAEIQVRQR